MKRRLAVVAAFALAVLLVAAPAATAKNPISEFLDELQVQDIRPHQRALQRIADRNNGTRLAGTSGYDQSAQYVARQLREEGYKPVLQAFEFPFFQELSTAVFERTAPTFQAYVAGTDFFTMTYSGTGDVTAAVNAIDLKIPPSPAAPPDPAYVPSTSGCEAADFTAANFQAGQIALIQRGFCSFAQKAANAQTAGAAGVVVFNEGNPGRTDAFAGTLGGPGFNVPVVGTSFAIGDVLRNGVTSGLTGVSVHLKTDTIAETRTTHNVIAETRGNRNHVVVVGAHLDSVGAGPGINDNGSGSGTILAIALQMAEDKVRTNKKVRFIWFGAEEEGLLGSEYYVGALPPRQLARIDLMLNFDMIGSPNFVRFVYDGDGSAGLSPPGPPGSDVIEDVFLEYFASRSLPNAPTAFDGRSDYGPFIAAGIPAGGLFTGAEGIKTPEQAAIYGGLAGAQFDPCYHQACDTFVGTGSGAGATPPGLGITALRQMSDGVAYAVLTLADVRGNN